MHKLTAAPGYASLVLVLLLATSLAAQQNEKAEKEGAKTIFYAPSTGAANNSERPARTPQQAGAQKPEGDKILVRKSQTAPAKNPALRYWFELEGAGQVGDDRIFYTGDRISLRLRSNVDGYLTLWACDSAGRSQLLFPRPGSSEDGYLVRANTDYAPGVIELSPPAEDERLLLFFAESKGDIPSPKQDSLSAEQIKLATQNTGLLFETEKTDPATFGSYVANRQGGAIAKEIRIKHRSR